MCAVTAYRGNAIRHIKAALPCYRDVAIPRVVGDEGGELGVSAGDPRLQFQACTSSDASRNKGSRQTSEATLIQ